MKFIYISIPINTPGYDIEKQRRKASKWQRYFEQQGYTVINPFELAEQLRKSYMLITGNEPTYNQYLHEDLMNVEDCQEIFLCEGWTESYGCMEEVDHSIKHGLIFRFESKERAKKIYGTIH